MTIAVQEQITRLQRAAEAQIGEARALPMSLYDDPQLLALEMDLVFRQSWICVGRLEQVENPGDWFTVEIAGEPVVVVRGMDGTLRALSSVCRHRYFTVAEGRGRSTRFTCPYHLWVYELDGRLRGAPHMGEVCDADGRPARLPEFCVDTWLGFIFLSLAETPAPLMHTVGGAEHYLRNYDIASWKVIPWVDEVWPGNWKLAMETALEGYHVTGLHPGTIDTFMPSRSARFQAAAADWTLFRLDTVYEGRFAALRQYADHMPEGEDRTSAPQFGFFPNSAVSCSQLSSIWLTFLPIDHQTTRVIGGNLVPPDYFAYLQAHPEAMQPNVDAVNAINAQDARAMVNLQKNVRSRFAAPGLLSEKERNLLCFYRYLYRKLAGVTHDSATSTEGTKA
jgi:phenylpropionate dioxygenase-like ring-hydroxylating dioxygenase large terminal subunit